MTQNPLLSIFAHVYSPSIVGSLYSTFCLSRFKMVFCDWLLSHNIMLSRSVHGIAYQYRWSLNSLRVSGADPLCNRPSDCLQLQSVLHIQGFSWLCGTVEHLLRGVTYQRTPAVQTCVVQGSTVLHFYSWMRCHILFIHYQRLFGPLLVWWDNKHSCARFYVHM